MAGMLRHQVEYKTTGRGGVCAAMADGLTAAGIPIPTRGTQWQAPCVMS